MSYDVVIVGSGLGGLVTGAKLAKEGRKVLIVEQHTSVGGYATSFTQNNFTIDIGFHSMDGLYPEDPKIKVFEDLDVYFDLELVPLPKEFYRYVNNRIDISIPNTSEEAIEVLSEHFPEEKRGIKSFFHHIENIFSSEWKNKTVGEMLDSMFKTNDLKLALAGTIQYYGDDPYTLSALSFGAALARNYKGGNHFIKGGSIKLTDYLANYIRKLGGTILVGKEVTTILISPEKNNVEGIKYKSTTIAEEEPTKVLANTVIINAPLPVAAELFSSESEKVSELKEVMKHIKIGHSNLNIYLGFDTTLDNLDHHNYLTVVNHKSVFGLKDIFVNNNRPYPQRNFIFIDYGQIDTGMAPYGKSTGMISMVDYYHNWDKFNKEEYSTQKKELERIFIDKLDLLIPGVWDHIEYISVATPKTMERYTRNPGGSVIGFARNPLQVRMYPLTSPIKNLYFASSWSVPGGGFTSIIDASWRAAVSILKKRR
jgi:phytoene dehydrogenase-like protein